jgi:hypothetical protein
LGRRIGPAVATGDDVLAFDRRRRLVARLFKHAAHDVLTLAPGCERCAAQAVVSLPLPKPFERADRRLLAVPNGSAVQSCAVFRVELGSAELGPDADSRPMTAAHIPGGDVVAALFAMQMRRARARHRLTG